MKAANNLMGVETAKHRHWNVWGPIAALLVIYGLRFAFYQQQQAAAFLPPSTQGPKPLKIAIFNQVNFHLHVVAGFMHVLQPMTTLPVTVYLPSRVLHDNWYGFMDWLGHKKGVVWRDINDYASSTQYDLVMFISPEWNISYVGRVAQQMNPRMPLFMLHNGHMSDADFNQIKALSPKLPLLTMGPHVAKYVHKRLQVNRTVGTTQEAEWLLPIYPFRSTIPCSFAQVQGGQNCLRGFSITGSMDASLRNYSRMWEHIRSYRQQHGSAALENFNLNILGEVLGNFTVPDDVQELVSLYPTPPDPLFYEVNHHSFALVPALANPHYYSSKLTSAVITSLMTGTPVLADSAFLSAYTMMEASAVFHQQPGQSELDAMFGIANMPAEEVWRTRAAVERLRMQMNARASSLIRWWMVQVGLLPETQQLEQLELHTNLEGAADQVLPS